VELISHLGRVGIRAFSAWVGAALCSLIFATAPAVCAADDITSSVSIARSGFVLNRTTQTFDMTVTIANASAVTFTGPFHLVLSSIVPASASLFNASGTTPQGLAYLALTVPNGTLAPKATATGVLKIAASATSGVSSLSLALLATPLTTANSAQITVQSFAPGADGQSPGAPLGAGYAVRIDGIQRAMTDSHGKATIIVPTSAHDVTVQMSPGSTGSTVLPTLIAGSVQTIRVVVGEGGEVYASGALRFDQVRNLVLARGLASLTLRFLNGESTIRIARIDFANVDDGSGNLTPIEDLLTVGANGTMSVAAGEFYSGLGAKAGRLELQVSAEDASGANTYYGAVAFYFGDFTGKVQLVAPPSQPALPLAGIAVQVAVLNTPIIVTVVTDATGAATLPTLPGGNWSLRAATSYGGLTYTGLGSTAVAQNELLQLTMRSPADILNGVPPLTVAPLAAAGVAGHVGALAALAALASPSGSSIYTAQQLQARRELAAKLNQRSVVRRQQLGVHAAQLLASPASQANSVNIQAVAGDEGVDITDSATLTVPKGTKTATVTYNVFTDEYPYYVLSQSQYNDTWGLSVLGGPGDFLFDISRQVNSQVFQDPVWQSDGSTGDIKQSIDVSALTATAGANLILVGRAQNVGDSILPTIVTASLSSTPQLVIDSITGDTINTTNDGSFYSIPRPGSSNLLNRTIDVSLTKPSGSTLSNAMVELRNGAGALMTVLDSVAIPSADATVVSQDDTTAILRLRATISNPASTVAGVPPPTNIITYHAKITGTDSNGNALSGEKDFDARHALWQMPDGLPRYGVRDPGGDDWSAVGTYNWLTNNNGLVNEIDDVSGEHGRDIGHLTHARGTDIDTFHFYRFAGVASGSDNYAQLQAKVIQAFGTIVPPNTPVPPPAQAAFNSVSGWLSASRTGIQNLAANGSVQQVIYCGGVAAQGLPAGWCNTLLRTGQVTRTITVNGTPPQQQQQTLNFGAWAGGAPTKLNNNNIHNSHIHVTLNVGNN
jgi:hypothetical protein